MDPVPPISLFAFDIAVHVHGPYHQWTVKKRGKTVTVYLDAEQVSICQLWIENNKRARTLMTQMQALALRIAQLHGIPLK